MSVTLGNNHSGNSYGRCRENERQLDVPDGIAVVGFDLRFPQDGETPEGFWKMMEERRGAMTDFPSERVNVDAFYDSTSTRSGTLRMRGGHFVRGDIAAFDADFFSIHATEACAMDPQQRILLETAYKAFESAGICLEDLRGSRTSVLTGCFTNDYFNQTLKDPQDFPSYMAIGATLAMLANRLSWFFDLEGPSYNIDAACASSALAVQQACEQLQRGDCDMALAAGCNLMLDPDFGIALGNMQFMSPDSRSFSFDSRGNGYARGEGVAVLILKRVVDAVRDNDPIRAVIRACKSNSDGRTPGITQPSSEAQLKLIEETYAAAKLSKSETRFFEAHGTGTPIGDPAEANAIIRAFRSFRSAEDPLYVGAVKTYIGHLEGAAGIAAVIKLVMSVEAGIILPNINFDQVNPQIYNTGSRIRFPLKSTAWPDCRIRRSSMSCFGYGGTNCHIIIDDAYSYLTNHNLSGNHNTNTLGLELVPGTLALGERLFPPDNFTSSSDNAVERRLLIWSANDELSLTRMIDQWKSYATDKIVDDLSDDALLNDIEKTLLYHRTMLKHRAFAVVNSLKSVGQQVQTFHTPKKVKPPAIALVFTGQGAQWAGMGRELMRFEGFAAIIDNATEVLASIGCAWSVKDLLMDKNDFNIDDPEYAAPLTTILQMALAELLRQAQICPVVVAGHSVGEIAAAYSAGAISRETAYILAYYRGKFVSTVPARDSVKGGMLSVGLSDDRAASYFDKITAQKSKYALSASCINSTENVTVSGELQQLDELESLLQEEGIFARKLRVNAAYHSRQLDQIAADCLEEYRKVQFELRSMTIPMVSTMTGDVISQRALACPEYWVDNMIYPVLFKQAVQKICIDAEESLTKKLDRSHCDAIVVDHIIEVGPHSALKLPIQQTVASITPARNIRYDTLLVRKQPADQTFLQLLGTLSCLGYPVDFSVLNTDFHKTVGRASPKILTDAPKYPFNHTKTFWHESHISRSYRLRPFGFVEGLGHRIRDWRSFAPEWRDRIAVSEYPWLSDHTIGGTTLYPAAAMIMMAVKGAIQLTEQPRSLTGLTVSQVDFASPLVFHDTSSTVEVRCVFLPAKSLTKRQPPQWSFQILSLMSGKWKLNCSGNIETHQDESRSIGWQAAPLIADFDLKSSECTDEVRGDEFYHKLEQQGFQYGPEFQGITSARYGDSGSAITTVKAHKNASERSTPRSDPYLPHPAILDSVFQSLLVALSKGGRDSISGSVVKGLNSIWISISEKTCSSSLLNICSWLSESTHGNSVGNITALDEAGEMVVLLIRGIEATKIVSEAGNQVAAVHGVGSCTTIRTFADNEPSLPEEPSNQSIAINNIEGTVNDNDNLITILVGHGSAIQKSLADELLLTAELHGKPTVNIHTLTEVTKVTSRGVLICLFEYDRPMLAALDQKDFEQLKTVLVSAQKIIWVTKGATCIRGSGFGMSQGFFRVFEREHPLIQVTILEIDWTSPDQRLAVECVLKVLRKVQRGTVSLEETYSVKDGMLCLSRETDDTSTAIAINSIINGYNKSEISLQQCRPFILRPADEKSFEEVTFQHDDRVGKHPFSDQVHICVSDISFSMPVQSRQPPGSEAPQLYRGYAGMISSGSFIADFKPGDRVCYLGQHGMLSDHHVSIAQLARIPDAISSGDAAAILSDIHIAFNIVQKFIKAAPGDAVLVTGENSFLRHAITALALDIGASVYITALSEMERSRIESIFGQNRVVTLPRQDIVGSVQRLRSQGVDAVVDLCGGTIKQDLVDCVSQFGQIVLLSCDSSVAVNATVPSNVCVRTITRDCIQDQSYCPQSVSLQSLLDKVLRFELEFDTVRKFPISRIRDAERQIANRNLEGKVVISLRNDDKLTFIEPLAPRHRFDPSVSYLIAGGLGVLGRRLANWMVKRGARNLILLSRSGPKSREAIELLSGLKKSEVNVAVPSCDISDAEFLAQVLEQCKLTMPPIKGCIQASGVIRDISYSKMDFADWQAVVKPKVDGSWNLHQLLPDNLDFFILTSSISGILGQATQINYAAANTYQDALARYRVSLGMKTVSLDLGVLLTGGMISKDPGLLERLLRKQELNPLSEHQITAIFDHFCDPTTRIVEPWQAQSVIGIRTPREILAATGTMPSAMYKPTWSLLRPSEREIEEVQQRLQQEQHGSGQNETAAAGDQRGPVRQLEELVTAALSAESLTVSASSSSPSSLLLSSPSLRTEAAAMVAAGLVGCVSRLLAVPEAGINVEQPLHVYGADSITALDVRAWIARTFAVDVPVFDLLGDDTSIAETGAVVAGLWLKARAERLGEGN